MGKGYGQFCPVAKAAEVFCERWTALLLRELGAGAERFSELQRGVPLMSPSMLSRRLRELEREGVIVRAGGGQGARYRLTPAGREFLPLVEALGVWGQRWSRRTLDEGELDPGLLLWDMERRVDCTALARGRSVVALELCDLAPAQRFWWFVGDGRSTHLCLHDPGFEVDLYLSATLADMIHVWRGDLPLARARDAGRLEAHGPPRLVRALPAWLNLSPLAAVPPARVS